MGCEGLKRVVTFFKVGYLILDVLERAWLVGRIARIRNHSLKKIEFNRFLVVLIEQFCSKIDRKRYIVWNIFGLLQN